LGLNGAGKSTALKMLAGLLTPSKGSIQINGHDATAASEKLKATIGFLPESVPLYDEMTVHEFLRHAGRLKGMTAAAIEARLPRVVEIADLLGREDQVIETLSYGYRKRVGIALAVIHDPKLVILDEPISGLDPVQIVEMRKVIRNLAKGRAVILSSHILGEISQTCDRILVVHQGRLVAQGTEQELLPDQGLRLQIVMRGDGATIEGFLSEHAGVEGFELSDEREGILTAKLTLASDTRETLVADLVAAGIGVRGVEEAEDELEAIFIQLTQQEAA
jgi:ABC-2 type transport system ATP-binding protein